VLLWLLLFGTLGVSLVVLLTPVVQGPLRCDLTVCLRDATTGQPITDAIAVLVPDAGWLVNPEYDLDRVIRDRRLGWGPKEIGDRYYDFPPLAVTTDEQGRAVFPGSALVDRSGLLVPYFGWNLGEYRMHYCPEVLVLDHPGYGRVQVHLVLREEPTQVGTWDRPHFEAGLGRVALVPSTQARSRHGG